MYLVYDQKAYDSDLKSFVQLLEYEVQLHDVHLLGLYRGGLPLAVYLSNRFNLPLSIGKMQRYDGDDKKFELIYNAGISSNQKIFIIDDIVDEGITLNKTVEYLRKHYPNNKIETLALFRSTKKKDILCDVTICRTSDEWVVFQPFGETIPND